MSEEMIDQEIEESHEDRDEQIASQSGWKPKDEWKGDPDAWRPAREFNERGEFINQIKKLHKKQTEMEKAIGVMGEINRRTAEIERDKAISDLKELRREAVRRQDVDAADDFSDKITELKNVEIPATVVESEQSPQPDDAFVAWVEENSWYMENKLLQGAANSLATEIQERMLEETGAVNRHKLLKEVERQIKQEFPSKFSQSRSRVADASQDKSHSGSPSKISSKLSEEEANVGRTLVRAGAFATLDDYAKSLKVSRG